MPRDARTQSEIEEIRAHLANLKQQPWLRRPQRWWPNFLFHCSDIRNVASILRNGEMLSRTRALASSQLHVDIAGPEIIARTDEIWQDYVRLYFRPKTPTQFQTEGFRPRGHQPYNVQCPVPVYLLVDAMEVLSKTGVLFTDGNVAAGPMPTDEIEFFKSIPFEAVYHDRGFSPAERDTIIYHRNAEVLVPGRLGTPAVRAVCCRSPAEYQTLLDLLPPGTLSNWVDRIGFYRDLNLFSKQWCFVEQVEAARESALFRFNVGNPSNPSGPFKARAELVDPFIGRREWCDDDFTIQETLRLRLNFQHPQDYTIKFFLDDHLAYSGRYQEELLPF